MSSLSGLTTINANGINTDDLQVVNITISGVGTAPTQTAGDSSSRLATTAFVTASTSSVLGTNNIWTGTNTFNGVTSAVTQAALDSSVKVATTAYTDTAVVNMRNSNNEWTAINNFSNTITTAVTQSSVNNSTRLATTAYTTTAITNLKSSANVWTGSNSYTVSLPTSTLTPSLGTELVTKTFMDSADTTSITNLKSGTNTWSGTNSYTGDVTLSANSLGVTPAAGDASSKVATTSFVSTAITNLKSAVNAWTGSNTYNTNLPTSTLTPTLGTELVTKNFMDSAITNLLPLVNNWTGFSNNFSQSLENSNFKSIRNPIVTGFSTSVETLITSNATIQIGTVTVTGINQTVNLTLTRGVRYEGITTGTVTETMARFFVKNSVGATVYTSSNYAYGSSFLILASTTVTRTSITESIALVPDNYTVWGEEYYTPVELLYQKWNLTPSTVSVTLSDTDVQVNGLFYTTAKFVNIRNAVAGVHIIDTDLQGWFPVFQSISDLANPYTGVGALTGESGAAVGAYSTSFNMSNKTDFICVKPGWGVIGYDSTLFGGTILANYYNNTNRIKLITPITPGNAISSIRVFFQHIEQIEF